MAARSMVRMPPVSSAAGPEVSICAGSGNSGVEAGGLAAAGESCAGLGATLAMTAGRCGAGKADGPDVFADAREPGPELHFPPPHRTGAPPQLPPPSPPPPPPPPPSQSHRPPHPRPL